MVVYSFKGERLAEHSYLVLRLYCGAFGWPHEKLIAGRIGADPKLVALTMRTACLLHDVGKALVDFQRNIEREKGSPFHEVLSACLTYDTLRAALSNAGTVARYQLSFAAAYSVLQHHQAMRGIDDVLSKGLGYLSSTECRLHEDLFAEIKLAAEMATCLLDTSDVLGAFQQSVERITKSNLREKLQEFISNFVGILNGQVPKSIRADKTEEWANAWERLQLALPLFTAPLQLCDYLAAYVVRGGRLRALHRETLLMLRNASRATSETGMCILGTQHNP